MNYFPQEFIKLVEKENVFLILLSFVKRFEWNNILLVSIEKIIKVALGKKERVIYEKLVENLMESIKGWREDIKSAGKFGRGFKGMLENIEALFQ